MMAEIEQRRGEVQALCRRFQVRHLAAFGSAVRGAFRPESSDLDFVVEFEGYETEGYAERYFGLLESLEELFGRPVDLVVESAIRNPYFRESVEANKTLLYAA